MQLSRRAPPFSGSEKFPRDANALTRPVFEFPAGPRSVFDGARLGEEFGARESVTGVPREAAAEEVVVAASSRAPRHLA